MTDDIKALVAQLHAQAELYERDMGETEAMLLREAADAQVPLVVKIVALLPPPSPLTVAIVEVGLQHFVVVLHPGESS